MNVIDQALGSVEAYVEFFSAASLPVLKRTNAELDGLRERADTIGAKRIAATVLGDPLMALKLLTYLETHRGARQNHDITTVDRAIMMIGVTPFFTRFSGIDTLEQALAAHPRALLGVLKVIGRARKAAHFARDWAVARHDLDVDEITVATLLHEAAEILCWTFAPRLTQQVADLLAANPGLRSVIAQRAVLGASFGDIQLALVRAWRLPPLLVDMMDPDHAENPRVRNVLLANDLARHAALGWDDPALPDDFDAIQSLIHVSRAQLLTRLGMPEEVQARYLPPPVEDEPTDSDGARDGGTD